MYPIYLLIVLMLSSHDTASSASFGYFKDQDSCKARAILVEHNHPDLRAFCVMSGSLKP